MAVQWWAGVDMPAALREMNAWASGNVLERRAAIAGLCEPALLTEPDHASAVLPMLDRVTTGVVPRGKPAPARRSAHCARRWATAGVWQSSCSRKSANRRWRAG